MEFSQEDVIESSQKSNKSRRGRLPRSNVSSQQRPLRTRKEPSARQQQLRSGGAFEIPQSSTEEDSASAATANLSGSLFSGQQELLQQYQVHEQHVQQRDEVLERVLEQSRKAYEQLKLQTEQHQQVPPLPSRDVFSEEVQLCSSREDVAPIAEYDRSEPITANDVGVQVELEPQPIINVDVPSRKDVALNTEPVVGKDVEVQVSHEPSRINRKEVGVQFGSAPAKRIDVALSPIRQKRSVIDAGVQSSPEKEIKRTKVDTGVGTDPIVRQDATVQTIAVEKCDVGVQKYHSTRVREAGIQAGTTTGVTRSTGKRNVCIQQRSTGMLEVNHENSLRLAIELRCDPARLQRLMVKVAARQCSLAKENDSTGRAAVVDFTEDDPYWANRGFFMDELVEDRISVGESTIAEGRRNMSCSIERSIP